MSAQGGSTGAPILGGGRGTPLSNNNSYIESQQNSIGN